VLAQRIASEANALVLRFDYDGLGDSAGSDEDPARVPSWIESVDLAIDAVKANAPGPGPVILVGLRTGALLASVVASRRSDISGFVFWAPSMSGREFTREQRSFALLAHATAAGPNAETIDWGKDGFEANGYVFTGETASALGQLTVDSIQESPSQNILVLDRAESPVKGNTFSRWKAAGATVEQVVISDYLSMIEPPLTLRIPSASISVVTDWVRRQHAPGPNLDSSAAPSRTGPAHVAPGVVEESVWYGESLFGILTIPNGHRPDRVIVFLNNAGGNRVGPHGMVPSIARCLAQANVASLRIDVAGVGDSELPKERPPHHPYDMTAVEDVRAAIAFLRRRGFSQIAAGGLCSAAFLAWHSAQTIPEITQLLLINPQTFEWKEGDSLEVSPLQQHYEFESYRQSLHSAEKWKKLLSGKVDLRYLTRTVLNRLTSAADARVQSARVALGIGGTNSPISRAVHALGQRGGHVSVIFSAGDPGIPNLERELSGAMRGLTRRGVLSVQVIDGPDHSFTPRWATRRLTDAIAGRLVGRSSAA
jgi:alpha/beta superfamily hydrolase